MDSLTDSFRDGFMETFIDGASDLCPFLSSSPPPPPTPPLTRPTRPPPRYHLRNRYRSHAQQRGRTVSASASASTTTTIKDSQSSIAELAKSLIARHEERKELMPVGEKGKYWTWAMWPGPKLGFPLQPDIENARGIFTAFLQSELPKDVAADYFSRGGPRVTIELMRAHVEGFVEVYNGMLDEGNENVRTKLSTQFVRNHATRIFTALSRVSNFVTMDVVMGTYEWIDEYLSVKYELRTYKDEKLDMSIPEINVEESIRSRSTNSSEECPPEAPVITYERLRG